MNNTHESIMPIRKYGLQINYEDNIIETDLIEVYRQHINILIGRWGLTTIFQKDISYCRTLYLQRQRLHHGHVGLIVRYDFVARLVSASHVKTPALVRDQLQVWLHHNGVEVFDTTVLLKQREWNRERQF